MVVAALGHSSSCRLPPIYRALGLLLSVLLKSVAQRERLVLTVTSPPDEGADGRQLIVLLSEGAEFEEFERVLLAEAADQERAKVHVAYPEKCEENE